MTQVEQQFVESVAARYRRRMVPLLFAPYAGQLADLVAGRLDARLPTREVLELAAGTGVLSRALATALPAASILATDVAAPMLAEAEQDEVATNLRYQIADATDLPFEDQSFDLVVSQFGVMFFDDKAKAFAEARRVLRPGAELVFLTWDRLERNELVNTIAETVDQLLAEPVSPWMKAGPHGYFDEATITRDVTACGLRVDTTTYVRAQTRVETPREAAEALCLGSPMRANIEADPDVSLDQAVRAVEQAVARRYGSGPVVTDLSAVLVTATRIHA